MAKSLTIKLKTLTPLWTGGVDQTCDRLHETGLIGSLRWWYEALVRGLGGYACDPTDKKSKCKEYDPKIGKRSICAACYLFGTTGWARLFRLQVLEGGIRQESLHFYTTLQANTGWLARIFGGDKRIDGMTVPFGEIQSVMVGRGQEDEYAISQLAWATQLAAQRGGLGAKLQHGFGQIVLMANLDTAQSEEILKEHLPEFRQGQNDSLWPSTRDFLSDDFPISEDHPLIHAILSGTRIGTAPPNTTYVSCVFDLRYKGNVVEGKQLGFRQWLINQRWNARDISALLGETRARRDEERAGSRIFFGMPWRHEQGGYRLRIFGFAPPTIELQKVRGEVKAYVGYLFDGEGRRSWIT